MFNSELAKINDGLPKGVTIHSVQIYFNYASGSFIYYTFKGASSIKHNITVQEDAVGKKVVLKSGTWDTPDGLAPIYLKDFDKYLIDAAGGVC